MAFRLVTLIVVTSFVTHLSGFNLSILRASLEIKFLPEPVSRSAQITFPSILTGKNGASVSSTEGVNPVKIEPFHFSASHTN